MSHPVKIRKIGNSLGVTISAQLREMGLGEGDSLFVVRTPNGIELTPGGGKVDAFRRGRPAPWAPDVKSGALSRRHPAGRRRAA